MTEPYHSDDLGCTSPCRELRDDTDGRPPLCEDHREVQHRDRRPPWCDSCGWRHEVPARPAQKVRDR